MKIVYIILIIFTICVVSLFGYQKDFSALKDLFTTFLGCFLGYVSGIVFRQHGDKKQFTLAELDELLSIIKVDIFEKAIIHDNKITNVNEFYRKLLLHQRKMNNQLDFVCQCLSTMNINTNELKAKVTNINDKLTNYDNFGPHYLETNHDAIRQNVTKERNNAIATINKARIKIIKKFF